MRNNIIIKSPYPVDTSSGLPSVFLAGSIEMGKAEDWQTPISEKLQGFIILNPRRDNWDSSWAQSIDNAPFREQVEWELNALELADEIIMFFSPGTYSPISLLELGLHAASGKLHVVCPEGFWRKGNVDIVCYKYQIAQYQHIDEVSAFLNQKYGR